MVMALGELDAEDMCTIMAHLGKGVPLKYKLSGYAPADDRS
jgi:hypothetical protein